MKTASQQSTTRITRVCRWVQSCDPLPTVDDMAGHAGLSRWHFHRLFRNVTGLTPGAWIRFVREQRVRDGLNTRKPVTDVIYDAGYNSDGRFYEQSTAILGMTPTRYRRGGQDMTIRFAVGQCSLGSILVASTDRGICAISLGDDSEELLQDLQKRFDNATFIGGDHEYEQWVAGVIGAIEQPQQAFELPLDIRGTAFQQRVWQTLRAIPPGETASYSDIARQLGFPGGARAVAGACAANPIAVAIPCHRVVRNDGSISGYRWGVERKRTLLSREAGHRDRS